jgi:hypothetical protein
VVIWGGVEEEIKGHEMRIQYMDGVVQNGEVRIHSGTLCFNATYGVDTKQCIKLYIYSYYYYTTYIAINDQYHLFKASSEI